MADEPDFSNKSNVELSHFMTQFPSSHAFYKLALSELSKREVKLNQIPTLPDEILIKIKDAADVPNPSGLGSEPINAELKRAATAELRKRESEKNIKAIQSDIQKLTIPHWTRNWTFYLVVVSIAIALAALVLQWRADVRDSKSSGISVPGVSQPTTTSLSSLPVSTQNK